MANVLLSTQNIHFYPDVQRAAAVEVTNVSSAPVLFHFLTTSPGRYSVKGKKGVIQPNSSAHVSVSLSSSQLAGGEGQGKIKDTFLCEYAVMDPEDNVGPSFSQLSALIRQKKSKGKVHKKTIACVIYTKSEQSEKQRKNNKADSEGSKQCQVAKSSSFDVFLRMAVVVLVVCLAVVIGMKLK